MIGDGLNFLSGGGAGSRTIPQARRHGLSRSFLRELLARADYSTSALISVGRAWRPLFRVRSRMTARRLHSYK